jgi:hypothetical protein
VPEKYKPRRGRPDNPETDLRILAVLSLLQTFRSPRLQLLTRPVLFRLRDMASLPLCNEGSYVLMLYSCGHHRAGVLSVSTLRHHLNVAYWALNYC